MRAPRGRSPTCWGPRLPRRRRPCPARPLRRRRQHHRLHRLVSVTVLRLSSNLQSHLLRACESSMSSGEPWPPHACSHMGTCTLGSFGICFATLFMLCKRAGPAPSAEDTAAPTGASAPGAQLQLRPASASTPPAGAPGDADAKAAARRTVMWSEMSDRPATPPADPAAGPGPSQNSTNPGSQVGDLLPDPSAGCMTASGSRSRTTCVWGALVAPGAGCSIRAGWTGRAQATREHAAGCLYWLARTEVACLTCHHYM